MGKGSSSHTSSSITKKKWIPRFEKRESTFVVLINSPNHSTIHRETDG